MAAVAALTFAPATARADAEVEAAPSAPPARDGKEAAPTEKPDEERPFDVGAIAGVGFPRPLAIEGVFRYRKTVLVGAEYSFMPKTSIASVDARMWGAAADVRVFPFQGAFFVGMRGGYQSISAEATISAANVGSYTESAEVSTWFVNPRLGFMWVWKPLTLGIDAGVQIPITTTVTRSSLLAVAAPDVDARVTTATDLLGRTVLPTVDLLRVGLVF